MKLSNLTELQDYGEEKKDTTQQQSSVKPVSIIPQAKSLASPVNYKPSKTGRSYNPTAIKEHLLSKGLSEHAVKGILGNIQRESNFNSKAVGDGNTSIGLFQHHADRAKKLGNYLKLRGKDLDDGLGQVDYAYEELKSMPKVMKMLNSAKSPAQAADIWVRHFERPANVNNESRIRQQYAMKYKFGGIPKYKLGYADFSSLGSSLGQIVDNTQDEENPSNLGGFASGALKWGSAGLSTGNPIIAGAAGLVGGIAGVIQAKKQKKLFQNKQQMKLGMFRNQMQDDSDARYQQFNQQSKNSLETYAKGGNIEDSPNYRKAVGLPKKNKSFFDYIDIPHKNLISYIGGNGDENYSDLLERKRLTDKTGYIKNIPKKYTDIIGKLGDIMVDPLNTIPFSKAKYFKGLKGIVKQPLPIINKIGNAVYYNQKIDDVNTVLEQKEKGGNTQPLYEAENKEVIVGQDVQGNTEQVASNIHEVQGKTHDEYNPNSINGTGEDIQGGDFVFSDSLTPNGKQSFAELAFKIGKQKGKNEIKLSKMKGTDYIFKNTYRANIQKADNDIQQLAQIQEVMKQQQGITNTGNQGRFGGLIKMDKGGDLKKQQQELAKEIQEVQVRIGQTGGSADSLNELVHRKNKIDIELYNINRDKLNRFKNSQSNVNKVNSIINKKLTALSGDVSKIKEYDALKNARDKWRKKVGDKSQTVEESFFTNIGNGFKKMFNGQINDINLIGTNNFGQRGKSLENQKIKSVVKTENRLQSKSSDIRPDIHEEKIKNPIVKNLKKGIVKQIQTATTPSTTISKPTVKFNDEAIKADIQFNRDALGLKSKFATLGTDRPKTMSLDDGIKNGSIGGKKFDFGKVKLGQASIFANYIANRTGINKMKTDVPVQLQENPDYMYRDSTGLQRQNVKSVFNSIANSPYSTQASKQESYGRTLDALNQVQDQENNRLFGYNQTYNQNRYGVRQQNNQMINNARVQEIQNQNQQKALQLENNNNLSGNLNTYQREQNDLMYKQHAMNNFIKIFADKSGMSLDETKKALGYKFGGFLNKKKKC